MRKKFVIASSERWVEEGVDQHQMESLSTGAVNNLDESGCFEFHGTAISFTSHLAHGNLGEDPSPLNLDLSNDSCLRFQSSLLIFPMLMTLLV